jgi:plastocyanin
MINYWSGIFVNNINTILSTFLLLTFIACGDKATSGTTSATGERLITIKITGNSIADMRFSPNNISIKKGDKVKLNLPIRFALKAYTKTGFW